MKKTTKIIIAILVVVIVITSVTAYFVLKPQKQFVLSYASVRKYTTPLLVAIDSTEKWQFSAAVCFASVANGMNFYTPLVFSTGEEMSEAVKALNLTQISISSFGGSASDASIKIADTYWDKIELAVIVSNYNDALLSAPLAAYLNAPLLFSGNNVKNFLKDRGIGSAVVIGTDKYDNVGVLNLKSRNEIWNFYIDRLKENHDACNYIVAANPNDIQEDSMVLGLSLCSGVVAAQRIALVITGDYTVGKEYLFNIGYGCGEAGSGERGEDADTLSDDAEITIQKTINTQAIKVDNDIDYAVEFLKDRGLTAEYLALVGMPDAVPMLYIKNPIWYEDANEGAENDGEEYLATDSYYSDLDLKLDTNKNVKGEYICYGDVDNDVGNYKGTNYDYANPDLYTQELAVGRIAASSLLDASALIARSLGYSKSSYSMIEDFNSILTSRVCGTASPGSAEQQANVFRTVPILSTRLQWPGTTLEKSAGFWLPKDISSSHAEPTNDPALMTKANFIIYDGHGFPDGWYYWWAHMHDVENSSDTIRTEDVKNLALKPSVIFSASCLCSALDWPVIWNGSTDERRYEDLGAEMFFSLAVLHAGALAHIGSTEESWGAFFGGALTGYGDFDLATIYFEKLLDSDLTIGEAHSRAKEEFIGSQSSDSLPFTQTCFLENVLYGEPAVNP